MLIFTYSKNNNIKYRKDDIDNMNNQDIREAIKSANLKYWQVADQYGLTDSNFSRLLRKELTNDKKEKVFEAIEAAKIKY